MRRRNYKRMFKRYNKKRIVTYKNTRKAKKRRVMRRGGWSVSRVRRVLYPDNLMMKHTWTYTSNAVVANANLYVHSPTLKINSLYDPDSNSTGWGNVSCSNYHNLKNIYNRYHVLGARIVVTVRPISMFNFAAVSGGTSTYSAVSCPPIRWGMYIDDNGVVEEGDSYEKIIGNKYHVYRDLQCNNNGSQDNKVTLIRKWSSRKYFGYTNDDRAVPFVGFDPANVVYAVVYGQVLDKSSSPIQNTYAITWNVSFIAKWSEIKENTTYQA